MSKFNNRDMYRIGRNIKSRILRKKDSIQNIVVICDNNMNLEIIDLIEKRDYLRKGHCVIGYFDYLPNITSLELNDIVKEVFNYGL